MNRKTLPLLITILLPVIAQAHEGHGLGHGHELGHYLLSAEHAIPVAAAVVLTIAVLAYRQWKKATSK